MSLLKKASIITTPTAYAEDYLYSIKPALSLGSSLTSSPVNLSNDFNANGSSSITDADTFTSTGNSLDGIASKTSVFTLTVGRRFQIEIQGDTTSSGFTLGAGNGNGDEYGSGFGVHTFVSTHAQLWIRQRTSGTTNITKLTIQEVTDADFDFDRNSTGTRVNEDYLIEDVPYNLLPQSNTFETTWQLVNATLNDGYYGVPKSYDAWLLTKSAANGRLNQFTSISSQTHTYSIYAKANDSSWMKLQVFDGSSFYFTTFNLSNGSIGTDSNLISSSIEGVRDGWYRCSIQFSAAITVAYIYPADGDNDTSGASGSIYIQNAQIVKGDQPKDYLKTTDRLDIPRIDYTNGEPSILLEPSRTNLIANNSDASAWGGFNNNVTFNLNDTTSPEGITNGHKINETTDNGQHKIDRSFSATSGTTYTYSFFAKQGTNKNVAIRVYGDNSVFTSEYVKYDLEKGTLTSGDGEIENYGNGWYRIYVTRTAAATATGFFGINLLDSNGNASYTGSTDNHIFIYGNQLEAGSYPTSLIHTSGSAVTRSADAANNAGNSDLINSTEGVLYGEIDFRNTTGNYISISNASGNRIIFGTENGSGRVYASSLVTYFTIDYGVYNKIAFSYKANERKLFVNGQSVYSSTATYTPPTGMNELSFDSTGAGHQKTQGNVKSVMVFKEALTDEELACLTGYNNHELYMNYYNRLSYLGLLEEYNVESDINNYIL